VYCEVPSPQDHLKHLQKATSWPILSFLSHKIEREIVPLLMFLYGNTISISLVQHLNTQGTKTEFEHICLLHWQLGANKAKENETISPRISFKSCAFSSARMIKSIELIL